MTKAYVLLEASWEYNDEYYYRPESEGGTPLKVFFDRKDAEEVCAELSLQKLKNKYNHEVFIYYGDWASGLSLDAINFLEKNGFNPEECYIDIPESLHPELAPLLEGLYYEIHEVDAEGNLK